MNRVWKEIKYFSQLFLLPVYGLSCLMPRNKRLWVLGSTFGRRFADNPKYFYLYLSQHKQKQVRAVWITKNREIAEFLQKNKLESYYLYSWKGIWCSLRAKVYLFDNYSKDICYTLSGGAVKINLWHGIPLKMIQMDNKFDHFRNPVNLFQKLYSIPRRISDEKPSHYVLTTSMFLKPIFQSAFHTRNVIVGGYPRNDFLISEGFPEIMKRQEKNLLDTLKEKRKENKIVLYMPTFRASESDFFHVINMESFGGFLKEEHILFCVKLHPKSGLQRKFNIIKNDHILVVDAQSDPYGLLRQADTLLTDYSSVYFDYLLTKKPVIFFPYDYKEYLTESREFYFDYERFTPGIKVYTQKELEHALINSNEIGREYEVIREKVFDTPDRNASEDLFKKVQKLLNKN